MRDDYEKATGETSWGSRLAEIGTEMVGDPINFIGGAGLLSKGSKLAQFGKRPYTSQELVLQVEVWQLLAMVKMMKRH